MNRKKSAPAEPNAYLNIRLTAKSPHEACGDSDSFRVKSRGARFDSDLSLNNRLRRSGTEETIDDDLSDVQSIPSITVTNDDYFKWNSRNQFNNSASSTPAHFQRQNGGNGISRSDTMTTLHTVSSFPATNEDGNGNHGNDQLSDDDGYETNARKTRTSSSNSKVSTIVDVKVGSQHDRPCGGHFVVNQRRSMCDLGSSSNDNVAKRLSMASKKDESPINFRASPRVHESVIVKTSLASKSRPQLA